MRENYYNDSKHVTDNNNERSHTTHVAHISNVVQKVSMLKNYIPIVINGHDMYALIDSGADVCVMREDVFHNIVKDNYVELHNDKDAIGNPDNKTIMNVTKHIRVRLSIAEILLHADFYIVQSLQTEIILGIDWLQKHNVKTDFGDKMLSIDPRRILLTDDDIVIPAKNEAVFIARIKGDSLPTGIIGTTDYCTQAVATGLLAGKTLTTVKDNKVYHTVANVTDTDIMLKKGARIGKFVALSGHDRMIDMKHTDNTVELQRHTDSKIQQQTYQPSTEINLDAQHLTDAQQALINTTVNDYADVFVAPGGKLGFCDVIEHEIELQPGAKPFSQRAYRLPPKLKEEMQKQIDDLIAQDVIEPSTSPWGSPCFLVAKKSGDYRFVVDLRKLNSCIKIDAHPIPTVEESLDFIGAQSPTYFSTLDLKSGFFQTPIKKESRGYTAFRTSSGLYQFKRSPMGLRNSSSFFQRLMENVFRGMTWRQVLIYI